MQTDTETSAGGKGWVSSRGTSPVHVYRAPLLNSSPSSTDPTFRSTPNLRSPSHTPLPSSFPTSPTLITHVTSSTPTNTPSLVTLFSDEALHQFSRGSCMCSVCVVCVCSVGGYILTSRYTQGSLSLLPFSSYCYYCCCQWHLFLVCRDSDLWSESPSPLSFHSSSAQMLVSEMQ